MSLFEDNLYYFRSAPGGKKLRVAKALFFLPHISGAYQNGELSYSKVVLRISPQIFFNKIKTVIAPPHMFFNDHQWHSKHAGGTQRKTSTADHYQVLVHVDEALATAFSLLLSYSASASSELTNDRN